MKRPTLFLLVKRSIKSLGLFLYIILLLAKPCHSQAPADPQYINRHFTDEDGLPQNSIKAIAGDKDGFIWLSTEDGLVRYDGQRFLTFNKLSIPVQSNRMGTFYPVNTSECNTFFAVSEYNDYLETKAGRVSVRSSGFEQFLSTIPFADEYKADKTLLMSYLPNSFAEMTKAEKCIIPDGAGGSFVCTRKKVARYQGTQKKYEVDFETSDDWIFPFFRTGKTLFAYDNRWQFSKIEDGIVEPLSLTGDILFHPGYRNNKTRFSIYWSNATEQAFLYCQRKLYRLVTASPGSLVTKLVLGDFDCELNNIIGAYYDELHHMLLLGSLNKGLFTFSPRYFRALTVGQNEMDEVYYAQAAWNDNQVITTQGNILGLQSFEVLPAMKKEALFDRYSMMIDTLGYIWARKGNSVNKFDKEGKQLISQMDIQSNVTQLYQGNDGQIWVGTRTRGLLRINPFDLNTEPQPFPTKPLLTQISCMQAEGKEVLWIGSDHGVYRLHLPSGRIDSVRGLEKYYVRSIYIPKPDEIWITTYGAGFFLYSDQRLTKYPTDKNGYLSTSHCIVEDNKGFFWITTNKGLFQASRKDLLNYAEGKQQDVFYLYRTREEGFYTNEFNGGCQPCAVKLANGYVSLPSLNGVVWFAPDKITTLLPDKKIFIDRIEMDQHVMPLGDTVELSRGFRQLNVFCATPYTGNDYNIRMQYAWVKGNEKPVWLLLDNGSKTISQSSLGHGTYTLLIRKMNGFGTDNYSYKELTVRVPPAFYETYWFYGATGLLFILLLWVYGRLRLRYIRHANKQLEKLVNDRTEELRKTLWALSLSEQNIRRQMKVREVLFTAISHDIRSPLRFMTMMAEELKKDLEKENVNDLAKKHASDIYESSYYIYHLTRNLLQYLRISESNAASKREEFELQPLVESKISIFQPIAQKVPLINKVPSQFYIHNDPLLLEVVIHNLLDNAVKVTRQGFVAVKAEMIEGHAHVIVEDTGPGMPKELADYYNKDVAATHTDEDIRPGFGLNIVRELTKLMGVKFRIEVSENGTSIHLIF